MKTTPEEPRVSEIQGGAYIFCHMNSYEILEIVNLYLLKLILIFYYTSFYVCVYLCVSVYMVVHISWGTHRGQKIAWRCGFSPSTLRSL